MTETHIVNGKSYTVTASPHRIAQFSINGMLVSEGQWHRDMAGDREAQKLNNN